LPKVIKVGSFVVDTVWSTYAPMGKFIDLGQEEVKGPPLYPITVASRSDKKLELCKSASFFGYNTLCL